jgi:hypothetical protein
VKIRRQCFLLTLTKKEILVLLIKKGLTMSELPQAGKSKTYQPTPEQLQRWREIDELESGAIAGLLPPEEEQARLVKEFLQTDFVADQLEKVRAHKEKLEKKLQSAQEYEQLLLEKQQRQG